MAVFKESLAGICLRLTLFWWIVLTVIVIGEDASILLDPAGFWAALYGRTWYVAASGVVAVVFTGLYVVLSKEKIVVDLKGRTELGIQTTMGKLPIPAGGLPRIKSPSQRLPIWDEELTVWLLSQNVPVEQIIPDASTGKSKAYTAEQAQFNAQCKAKLNESIRGHRSFALLASDYAGEEKAKPITPYGNLFLAIWDTYCAHKHYPASHRAGGHGDTSLHEHCLNVAARSLCEISSDGGNWSFDGVYVKRRGRNPIKLIENTTGYQLNRSDPLVPIIGLAHDLGKLEAYDVDKKGNIKKNREPHGNTLADDDKGVIHDVLGPRILSRMPEFWTLPPQDRAAINTAIAHYHHPSRIPLNNHRMLNDPRAAALMMLLITSDRAVSALEAGIDAEEKEAQELSPESIEAIYEVFVAIITTHGRINGVGNPMEDAQIRIGQKHQDFIAIKMGALLGLMRHELGISVEGGDNKHALTNQLLAILKEKDLLYTVHEGVDFSLYNPLYRVGLYHHSKTKHLADIAPALLLKIPPVEMEEFYTLTHLALNPCNVVVKNLILSHIPKDKIKDKAHLDGLMERAFGVEGGKIDIHEEIVEDEIVAPSTASKEQATSPEGDSDDAGEQKASLSSGVAEDDTSSKSEPPCASEPDVAKEQDETPAKKGLPKDVAKALSQLKKGTALDDSVRLLEERKRREKNPAKSKSDSVASLADDDGPDPYENNELFDRPPPPKAGKGKGKLPQRDSLPVVAASSATENVAPEKSQTQHPGGATPSERESTSIEDVAAAEVTQSQAIEPSEQGGEQLSLSVESVEDDPQTNIGEMCATVPEESAETAEATVQDDGWPPEQSIQADATDTPARDDSDEIMSEEEYLLLNGEVSDELVFDAGKAETDDDIELPEDVPGDDLEDAELSAGPAEAELSHEPAPLRQSSEAVGDSTRPQAPRTPQKSKVVVVRRQGETF